MSEAVDRQPVAALRLRLATFSIATRDPATGMLGVAVSSKALAKDHHAAYRQLNVVDALGRSATYTGAKTDAWCGGCHGAGYAIAGNILVSEDTVAELRRVYQVAVTEGNGEELAFYARVSSQEGAAEDPGELP